MKRALILFVVLFVALASACGPAAATVPAGRPAAAAAPRPAPAAAIAVPDVEMTFDIAEMLCHTCASQVAAGAQRIPGVTHVSSDGLSHKLIVRFDPTRTTERTVSIAIDKVVTEIVQ